MNRSRSDHNGKPAHPTGRGIRWPLRLGGSMVLASALAMSAPVGAQSARTTPKTDSSTVRNSAMDAELFYQLLISELELRKGQPAVAFQVMLDAARRTRDDALFQRAVDIAIGARSADQAIAALKAWRAAMPRSRQAAESQAQVLMALGRHAEAQEAVKALIELTPATDRATLIAALPRLVLPGEQAKAAAGALDEVLRPWQSVVTTRASALLASGRAWALAGDVQRSLKFATDLQKLDPQSEGAALLALELWGRDPRAEALLKAYVRTPKATSPIRLGYARRLTSSQRFAEAMALTQSLTSTDSQFASAWLIQGALQIELGQPEAAQQSLQKYLDLSEASATKAPGLDDDEEASDASDAPPSAQSQELNQAYLMLSQTAEQLKDYAGAQRWLERLGESQAVPGVTLRRASLLARQGKLDEALALVRSLPERTPDELRARVMGETQLLREARQWTQAYTLLQTASQRLPNDPDLLYEQALLAEKLRRHDEMEALLRRVIELKPDQQHAYNALGYSMAERNVQLPEARALIQKAMELAPGDPYITDSMGWVEFRLGRLSEALAWLQKAYALREDVEIGVHLGEVLWTLGQRDEALRIWRSAFEREATNEVLTETLTRLKVRL